MDEISSCIVSMWFFPVLVFIVLPLAGACLWLLYSSLEIFKPIAGQGRGEIKTRGRRKEKSDAEPVYKKRFYSEW